MSQIDVSIVIPALNEERTIALVIEQVLAIPLVTQVIVVNDGSTDKTGEILESFGSKIEVVTNPKPSGKGAAIRAAVPLILGQATIIQDADLEYLPSEIPALVQPILDGKETVVYGSRFTNGYPKSMALPNKIVNWMLAKAVRVLFGQKITDEATCYKAIRSELLRKMDLQCIRFEFCPEVTAKAIRMGETIAERPISYTARSKKEGKKIRWTDAPDAFFTLWKYRNWTK
jgi:glycosyltransferase involved in cell wall biosynthesis